MKEEMTIEKAQKEHTCRKVFEIMIHDKPYQVWGIEGLEHEAGK